MLTILLFTLFLIWILKSLTSREIYSAMKSKGINPKSFFSRPLTGVICGIILVVILYIQIATIKHLFMLLYMLTTKIYYIFKLQR